MERNWNYTLKLMERGPEASYFMLNILEVMKQGYCILEEIADTYRNIPAIQSSLKISSGDSKQSLQDLYNAVFETYSGDEYQEKRRTEHFCHHYRTKENCHYIKRSKQWLIPLLFYMNVIGESF